MTLEAKPTICLMKGSFLRFTRCLLLAALLLFSACDFLPSKQLPIIEFSGSTMGTYYRIVVIDDVDHFSTVLDHSHFSQANFQETLDSLLEKILSSMSTYQVDSEVSHFNRLPSSSCQTISPDFAQVVSLALSISYQSEGYFNPLLNPLVTRWGFDSQDKPVTLPSSDEIDRLLELATLDALSLDLVDKKLCKSKPVQLDLSAIAKGYTVDQIARLLMQMGAKDFLVDIGGEVRVLGKNTRQQPWRLAIETPDRSSSIQEVVQLSKHAIATSGDYRNYYIHEGQYYSHLIDPKTGFPISHTIASVSVISDTTAVADAWATALIAMGEVNAKRITESEGLAVMMVFRENEASTNTELFDYANPARFRTWTSQAFKPFIDIIN
ncbi:MAG: thiamine biosynthesis protein ApbE [Cellvibrionales bacterium]|nr:thiamine biosynthesis protein ApbE [Cellvibrionales bacterium]|tara:strand:+ start:1845 stop:2987 length:1143 start_codon:yes stop_codon:yes gene_type:complete